MSNTNFKVNTNTDLDDLFVRRSLFTRGGLWGWGSNQFGQLGNNTTTTPYTSPIQTILAASDWKSVTGGGWPRISSIGYTAGIKTDGTLWMWGSNGSGQLGKNDTTNRSSPVQTVTGGTNWREVACADTGSHTAAIKTDGTLWLWGDNNTGELGDNTTTNKSSPVQTVSGGTVWRNVSCGDSHTAAIKTDGTLWAWGAAGQGQLGNNAQTDRSSPVQEISSGIDWKQVSCGTSFTAAIKTTGTLWLWGDNTYGQLGDNSITLRSSPVQTVSSGTNWKQVSLRYYYAAAIKTDGTLWTWGRNLEGVLGDSSTTNKSSPVQTAAGGTNWLRVEACGDHTMALKTDRTLWMWGRNTEGQIGGVGASTSSPVSNLTGSDWKLIGGTFNESFAVRESN